MCLKEINYTEERFKLLVPRPMPLIDNFIKITNDGIISCICPKSENMIEISKDGKISCDVARVGKKTCGSIGLEEEICPYNPYIKEKNPKN